MSIATTAPESFAFQDIVCVETMLRHTADTRFFIERPGGEDATMEVSTGTAACRVEIQVKKSTKAISLRTVATWLTHTPPLASGDTLLERLLEDPTLFVVFVTSGRCRDDCARYVADPEWTPTPHAIGRVTSTAAADLLREFAVAKPTGKQIALRRRAHNESFAKSADTSSVAQALRRVLVVERQDYDSVKDGCANTLRRQYRVPNDRVGTVLQSLLEVVKSAKTSKADAFPEFTATLQVETHDSIRPTNYVPRGSESSLARELSRCGALLLSGIPRTGKTYLARAVAAEFETQGYDVQPAHHVDAAERFLLAPGDAHVLVVLDDPLDNTLPFVALSKLAKILDELPPHRRLVVSQAQEHLLAATDEAQLADVRTSSQPLARCRGKSVARLSRGTLGTARRQQPNGR